MGRSSNRIKMSSCLNLPHLHASTISRCFKVSITFSGQDTLLLVVTMQVLLFSSCIGTVEEEFRKKKHVRTYECVLSSSISLSLSTADKTKSLEKKFRSMTVISNSIFGRIPVGYHPGSGTIGKRRKFAIRGYHYQGKFTVFPPPIGPDNPAKFSDMPKTVVTIEPLSAYLITGRLNALRSPLGW